MSTPGTSGLRKIRFSDEAPTNQAEWFHDALHKGGFKKTLSGRYVDVNGNYYNSPADVVRVYKIQKKYGHDY